MTRLLAPVVLALLLIAAPASAQEISELWIETAAGPRYQIGRAHV